MTSPSDACDRRSRSPSRTRDRRGWSAWRRSVWLHWHGPALERQVPRLQPAVLQARVVAERRVRQKELHILRYVERIGRKGADPTGIGVGDVVRGVSCKRDQRTEGPLVRGTVGRDGVG